MKPFRLGKMNLFNNPKSFLASASNTIACAMGGAMVGNYILSMSGAVCGLLLGAMLGVFITYRDQKNSNPGVEVDLVDFQSGSDELTFKAKRSEVKNSLEKGSGSANFIVHLDKEELQKINQSRHSPFASH